MITLLLTIALAHCSAGVQFAWGQDGDPASLEALDLSSTETLPQLPGLADKVKSLLTLEKPKKHYQIVFSLDASRSMRNKTQALKDKVMGLMRHAQAQLEAGGFVSFGVRYYVDHTYRRPVSLESIEFLKKEGRTAGSLGRQSARVKRGVEEAIHFTLEAGGDIECHWLESIKAIEEESWSPGPDVERVLILITDEPGDICSGSNTKSDVFKKAREKNIRYELIRWEDGEPTQGSSMLEAIQARDPSKEEDPRARERAIMALAQSGNPRVIMLLDQSRDPKKETDASVRHVAVRALVRIGGPKVIPLLASSMAPDQEPSEDVRAGVAKVLGDFGYPQAVPLLARMSDSNMEPVAYVRFYAINALAKINGPEAILCLKRAAVQDPNWDVRYRARSLLPQLGQPIPEENP